MDLERFENNINDKFKNFEPQVDDSMIWDKIEADLPSKKKRKPFWLFGFLLIPAFYLVAFHGAEDHKDNLISEVVNAENKIKDLGATDLKTKKIDNLVTDGKEEIDLSVLKEGTEQVRKTNIQQSNTGLSHQVDFNYEKTIEAQSIFEEENPIESNNGNSLNPSAPFAQAKKKEKRNDKGLSTQEQVGKDVSTKSKSTESSGGLNAIEEDLEKVVVDQNVNEKKKPKQEALPKDEEKTDLVKPVQDGEEIQSYKTTSLPKMKEEDSQTDENLSDPIAETKVEKVVHSKKGSLSFTTGILMGIRSYEQATDEQVALMIAEKEIAEKQLETLQFDLQYKYRVTNEFAIGLGLRHWKHTERSIHVTARDYQDIIDVVTGIVHHVDGTTTETFSSIPVNINERVENTRYQTHASWSVPVKIYYTLSASNKWRAELGLGYELSIRGKHSGYELGPDETEYFITEDLDERYKNRGGNFFLANFNTNYKINRSIELTAGLEGKYGLNGFNTASTIYKKKYHFLGLYAGLNYTF